ncbi:uncharacterized protein LOC143558917 [Bidens hawaiensis]|uniref:uncharacterized protein LOC143558917 n=1 Tax=Bidens hawaiensis TaxID=980011 RepID=UPI004049156D
METNQQDWELVNDDGFIYRRLKRTHLNPTTTVPPSDPATEAKARRDRKKKTLLTLKTKYQQEIHHWQLLSNTLHALQQQHSTLNQPSPLTSLPPSDHTVSVIHDSTYHQLAGNLLAQVEAQEATISEISRLCDVAEAHSDAEEQRFIDLPIWEQSPRGLIASLLEE